MANRPGGNNPLGRNQYSPRVPVGGGSLLNVSIDVAGLRKMVTDQINKAKRVDTPILDANRYLAAQLQEAQQGVLNDALRSGEFNQSGRRRPQYREQALVNALTSPANRYVNVSGFTVGRLDEIPSVRQYWRGLEYGSNAHIGQFLPGYFVDEGGTPVPFDVTRADRFQLRGRGPNMLTGVPATYKRDPGRQRTPFRARISRPIKAIAFQQRGYEEWRAMEGSNKEILDTYAWFLNRAGADFGLGPGAIRPTRSGFGRGPQAGRSTSRNSYRSRG